MTLGCPDCGSLITNQHWSTCKRHPSNIVPIVAYFIWYKVNGFPQCQKAFKDFWDFAKGSEAAIYWKNNTIKQIPLTQAEFDLPLWELSQRYPCPEIPNEPKHRLPLV